VKTSNIEVTTKLDSRLPKSNGGSAPASAGLFELINNARQAIEMHQPGGAIRISSESSA